MDVRRAVILNLLATVCCTTIRIKQGLLRGEVLEAVTGNCRYHSFKGIPYATPPVGNLRFKAPEPATPWTGTRDATKHGSVCTQYNFLAIETEERHLGTEDCLFLNVYSPNMNPKEPLPVVIFIHGGGFSCGSGNVDDYGPDFLVCEQIVVVTINYRVGLLGFLSLDTEDVPGNAGMKDQVEAFKWVQENIGYFGGDPNKVTIMGQSAGGVSVGLHLMSPMSQGLYQRAIVMSGVPMCDFGAPYQPRRRAFKLAKKLGFVTTDPRELLSFLQSVPPEQFIDTYAPVIHIEELWKKDIYKVHVSTPVLENFGNNSFLRSTKDLNTYIKAIDTGLVNDADIFIGHTDQESIFLLNEDYLKLYDDNPELFVLKKLFVAMKPNTVLDLIEIIQRQYFNGKPINMDVIKEFAVYSSEANFISDIRRFVDKLQNPHNRRRYFYTFSCVSDRNYYTKGVAKYGLHGASHLEDLLYIFDAKKLNMTIDKKGREYELIKKTTNIFGNFIKYGNPTPSPISGLNWPEYNNKDKMYVDINDELKLRQDPGGKGARFWREIYDSVLHI
ncbi:juvenile hormone esterase-like [Manduca sexta]|uniref:juvenile hormone esterase-like n=1 Tax=Manduca sexta TaxID=7130 RepID=UPI00188E56B1|nr:juvenile hormone esterase-like [Manduca sexta]